MKAKLNILHITDFHIDDPEGSAENLRKAQFKPFVNGFVKAINGIVENKVDYIVTTGDYVNKGKTENFEHCKLILEHISSELKVPMNKIITCIGNHDYDIQNDEIDAADARKEYYKFADNFNGYNNLESNEYLTILKDDDNDIYFIVFDSTYGAKGENVPSKLDDQKIDNLYLIIEENVPADKICFIISHYPMDQPSKTEFIVEEDQWSNNHLWKSGYLLSEKINDYRNKSQTIYLHGDGHSPDFWSRSNSHHFFMTGMIGGSTDNLYIGKGGEKQSWNKETELKLISIEEVGFQAYNLMYKSKGNKFSIHSGEWQITKSGPRSKFKNQDLKEKQNLKEDPNLVKSLSKSILQSSNINLISTSIQNKIIEEVSSKNLYSFGHHITSDKYSSLGWIDINSLMSSTVLFARCVEKAHNYIRQNLKLVAPSQSTVLIGLDFWGSCLAANIGVLSGDKSFCVATKSRGVYNIKDETIENLKLDELGVQDLILVSDVVSTGSSIHSVAANIRSNFSSELNIYSISIISDASHFRDSYLNQFKDLATFCKRLKIPTIPLEDLPDDTILTPSIDIS